MLCCESRSGGGWFFGRVEILASSLWKGFSKLRDAGREDCFRSEQGYPEFSVQEEAGQLRGAECQEKRTGFFEEERSFSWSGAHDTVLAYADLFSILHGDNIQEFDTRWYEVPLSLSKISSDDIFQSLYKCSQGDRCNFRHENQNRAQ